MRPECMRLPCGAARSLAAAVALAAMASAGTLAATERAATASAATPVGVIPSVAGTTAAVAAELRPFSARYDVSWKGLSAASATLELAKDGAAGRYVYRSRNNARGMFRMAFPDEALQTSNLTLGVEGVRPLRFRGEDGTGKPEKSVSLDFDWSRARVTGVAEGSVVDLPLAAGVQDALSAQIALMLDLAAGRAPVQFQLVDRDQLKTYRYESSPPERLQTRLGTLDTVVYASRRDGSDRLTRVWYAPSLGFVPVRAERLRRGKLEFAMQIDRLTR